MGRALAAIGNEPSSRHCRPAETHGDQRWDVGWSITEVVRDYQLLRLELIEHLDRTLHRQLTVNEILALNTAIDDAIATSVTTYHAAQEQDGKPRSTDQAERDDVFALLGHELRNALAPLADSLHVLELASNDALMRERVQELMGRQVKVMTRLVDDLMDVTRLKRGKVRLKCSRIDLADLVRHSVDDRREAFREAGISFDASIPRKPIWGHGDRTRLTQVVANLLGNALKFTSSGGAVTVSLVAFSERGVCELRVKDSGIGIDPSAFQTIFEAFHQSEHSSDHARSGLGLGLALVRGLVELHGGTVQAHSEGIGHGAEFVCELPLLYGGDTGEEKGPREIASSTTAQTVLLIDDNEPLTEVTRLALELQGHSVMVAGTGQIGLEMALGHQPNVIFCDIGLPDMNGCDVVRKLKASRNDAFCVAISGRAEVSTGRRLFKRGLTHF